MRRFSVDYLEQTRRGMWEQSRAALEPLELKNRELIVDVGCGTGKLSAVLAEETAGTVVGIDGDRQLLEAASVSTVEGDATELPIRDDTADVVVCQALLINLPDPERAIAEFVRCSSDCVAAVEPDNSAVTVESTIPAETELAARARKHYIRGTNTDITLGTIPEMLERHDVANIETRRYDHVRTIEPPYEPHAFEAAKKKATGSRLAQQRDTLLAGGMSVADYDELRTAWREMGRAVIEAMQTKTYHRTETTPFYVTVGEV